MGQILLEHKSVSKDDSVLVSKKFFSNLDEEKAFLLTYIWRGNLPLHQMWDKRGIAITFLLLFSIESCWQLSYTYREKRNKHYGRQAIALTRDIADKTSMVFIARSKWCHPDHVDPNTYNVGFEIINMAPGDMVIFQRMFEKYGSQNTTRNRSSDDYLWK